MDGSGVERLEKKTLRDSTLVGVNRRVEKVLHFAFTGEVREVLLTSRRSWN